MHCHSPVGFEPENTKEKNYEICAAFSKKQ